LQVDSGDLLFSSLAVPDVERDQRRLKAGLLLAAQKKLGLDALTPGDGDLAFGLDFLVDGVAKNSLPYVSANLARPDGGLVFPATLVVERSGLKVGITGAIGADFAVPDATILPPEPAVAKAVASLRSQGVDLVILLSHLGLKGDKAMATAVPGIDAIFGGHDRRHQETPAVVAKTAIFQAGSRAKYVGRATLTLVPGAEGWSDEKGRAAAVKQKERTEAQVKRYAQELADATDDATKKRLERVLTFARRRVAELVVPEEVSGPTNRIEATKIPMGASLADEEAMKVLVDATLEKLGPEASTAHRPVHGKVKPLAGPYVGAQACRTCHAREYADWSGSDHARAYAALIRVKRQFDQQCWSCHVTGAGQKGGPQGPNAVGALRNVQCEACHGPGKAHVVRPVAGTIERAPEEPLCLTCHTEEQTEGRFSFRDYLPKIDHRP